MYTYYLSQGVGLPSIPIVAAGEAVLRGQLIAKKPDGLGLNLHASISGQVAEVSDTSIKIEETDTDFSDYLPLSKDTPLAMIEAAGIAGLGGAGFPTAEKLKVKLSQKGTLIINAVECEPILSHNLARLTQFPEQLSEAVKIVADILSIKNCMVAVKQKHKELVNLLKLHSKGLYEVKELADLYPTGDERAVIRDSLGVLLAVNELPSAADCVVLNAETAIRIWEAVTKKKPLIDKDVTVAGKLKKNADTQIFYDVPIGMTVSKVFEKAGGLSHSYGELIMGGPFTGKSVSAEDSIKKTTGGLIAAECYPHVQTKIGLLVCACGAGEERMREQAQNMNADICGTVYCKQAKAVGRGYKCENPGHCPGQMQKILELKKSGAEAVLMGNCTDCSNTVMSIAPKLGLAVHHATDQALRSVNMSLVRRMK